MLRDLAIEAPGSTIESDVLVIGAGVAGLLLATRLAQRGRRVVVMESGGHQQNEETHPLNEVVQIATPYAGATLGRFRCLGGTSTRWGGAMLPFLEADMTGESNWPVSHADLLKYLPEVESAFDLPVGPYEQPALIQSNDASPLDFVPRLAKWPPFGKRNLALLFDRQIKSQAGPDVWLNATATAFDLHPNGRLSRVTAVAPTGNTLRVAAKETVVAAGAIESTRLLLLADLQLEGRLFTPDDVLGRYFHDHLSVEIGKIIPRDRKALNRVAGFQFQGTGMRNLRFEPAERREVREAVRPGFAHIAFAASGYSGFDALRDVYRNLQRGAHPTSAQLRNLLKHIPWLMQAAWWRFAEHRLLYPDTADIQLHIVIEQVPRARNRIGLSRDRRDRHGTPMATIDWEIDEEDLRALFCASDRFLATWKGSSLAALGTIQQHPRDMTLISLQQGAGIFHPGGSTRMGTNPRTGVVDSHLRTFRVPNLRVASTSTFPSGGGANPTMMLMMATMRMADHLQQTLSV